MKSFVPAILVASVLAFAYCSPVIAKVLEMPMVQNFHSEFRESGSKLHISGINGNSAYLMQRVSIKKTKAEISVLIHLTLFRKGQGFDFDEEIDIPPLVNRVTFGKEK